MAHGVLAPNGDREEVRDGVGALFDAIDALIGRAATGHVDGRMAEEINDLLSSGYARALASDGELRRLERRIHELSEAGDAAGIGSLVAQRRHTTAEAMRLRARLDVLGAHLRRRISSACRRCTVELTNSIV